MEKIVKKFGKVLAVSDFNLEIDDGEFVTFLGPSGCGKTTTLRMIAGFEDPTEGRITIGERVVFSHADGINIPPEERNIGMVFQNYAVWPHMTVFNNVAYPLKIRGLSHEKIKEKVMEALSIVRLEGFEKRYPWQMSGGQQQRVAFARALVYSPEVLLLDEPLSNLDAKLREEMRFETQEIQRKTNITVVYVTHDQAEAMVMSDRIVVMKEGKIQQIGPPMEIYEAPANEFVADFIGLSNFIKGEVLDQGEGNATVKLIELEEAPVVTFPVRKRANKRDVLVVVRPEDIVITEEGSVKGVVDKVVYLGDRMDYRVRSGEKTIRIIASKEILRKEGERVGITIKKGALI